MGHMLPPELVDMKELIESGKPLEVINEQVENLISKSPLILDMFDPNHDIDTMRIQMMLVLEGKKTDLSCKLCKKTASDLQKYHTSVYDQIFWELFLASICWFKMNLGHCLGIQLNSVPNVGEALSSFFYEPEFFCKEVIDSCPHESQYKFLDPVDYQKRVVGSKPEELKSNDYIDKLYEGLDQDPETFSIVQFTDVHLDLQYEPGTDTLCQAVICCR